jgi:hypothetical protein
MTAVSGTIAGKMRRKVRLPGMHFNPSLHTQAISHPACPVDRSAPIPARRPRFPGLNHAPGTARQLSLATSDHKTTGRNARGKRTSGTAPRPRSLRGRAILGGL